MLVTRFLSGCVRLALRGGKLYYAWLAILVALIAVGAAGYVEQLQGGLIRTNMRDPVSWSFYIGNFTFLVGVAAAAIVLVIPAYVYHWKPIKEIVLVGELLAVSALAMCLMFVSIDVGRPDRLWHLMPFVGRWNMPSSLLAWDVLVLNLYLVINLVIVGHLLYRAWAGREPSARFAMPLILLSIPIAVAIHTVTAFVYAGLAARPFWNAAILAPRFLASAFCSGPAVILIVLALLRRTERLDIKDEAMWKIGELMAYAMFVYLFLLGAEFFRDVYSSTQHALFTDYVFRGLGEHAALVPYAWLSLLFCVGAFLLFLFPRTRRNPLTLNLGALLAFLGIYVEKGNVLVIAGFTPSTLGEIYEYSPSRVEVMVAFGVYGVGALIYTLLLRVAVPILDGRFQAASLEGARPPSAPVAVAGDAPAAPAGEPPPEVGGAAGEDLPAVAAAEGPAAQDEAVDAEAGREEG
jgi:Ni/Fe-hydrogenase subunit HybB-like protein